MARFPLLEQMVVARAPRDIIARAVVASRTLASTHVSAAAPQGAASSSGALPPAVPHSAAPSSEAPEPSAPHPAAPEPAVSQTAALLSAAMTHAWLFTGPPGAGRSTAAHAFAASLVCTSETPGCGTCQGCRSALAGTHADIVTIRPEGVQIPVALVRSTVEAASRKPTTAPWRVVIIEDADRLNDPGANALLKSIEEPPARTVFLLCAPSTDPADIHVTIRSRCRHVYIPTPSTGDIVDILTREAHAGTLHSPSPADATTPGATTPRATTPRATSAGSSPAGSTRSGTAPAGNAASDTSIEQRIQWAASVCGGHVGRARRLVKDEAARTARATALKLPQLIWEPATPYQFVSRLVSQAQAAADAATAEHNAAERAALENALGVGAKGKGAAKATRGATTAIRDLEREQKNRRTRHIVDSLDLALMDIVGLYRDALVIATAAEAQPQHPDYAEVARRLAQRIGSDGALACIDAVQWARQLLAQQITPEVVLHALVGRLQEVCVFAPAPSAN